MKKKQFFQFIADFFDKYDDGHFSHNTSIKFTEAEKEKWIKKYFLKYFSNQVEPLTEKIRINTSLKMDTDQRTCSCTVGMYDAKSGKLIPPSELPQNKAKKNKFKYITIQKEIATKDMRDAQLGRSLGIKTTMKQKEAEEALDQILERKI